MELRSRLLSARGETLGEWIVDPDVCTCCQTTLVTLPGDRVFVAYRGRTREEIRDHGWAVFEHGRWSRPEVLHADRWQIAGCPVNGPAADAHDPHLAVAWFTAAEGRPRVQAVVSEALRPAFGQPLAIDLGAPVGRVETVTLPDGSAVVVWIESGRATAAALYVRRVFADRSRSAPVKIADVSAGRLSGFPRAARWGDQVIVTWTAVLDDHSTRVMTISLDPSQLPPLAPVATGAGTPPTAVRAPLELCGAAGPASALHP